MLVTSRLLIGPVKNVVLFISSNVAVVYIHITKSYYIHIISAKMVVQSKPCV